MTIKRDWIVCILAYYLQRESLGAASGCCEPKCPGAVVGPVGPHKFCGTTCRAENLHMLNSALRRVGASNAPLWSEHRAIAYQTSLSALRLLN
jgi:hypothetical protein